MIISVVYDTSLAKAAQQRINLYCGSATAVRPDTKTIKVLGKWQFVKIALVNRRCIVKIFFVAGRFGIDR